ncbi:type I restriction endonuclease subunit R [Staphylococcus epidermidis]|uniref:Type I restriction enzyme endonuclease subunit n=7 Tax=Staphylococcus TaxID=1279 RepID=A0A509LP14_STAEP|nr:MULTISPECIES: type I restriction endonuclease subunit R [Staphylococcus]EJE32213.1 type I site-specific deoxyribonuclease, HsdR family [Staphylococcus epidermidis NIH04008]EZI13336.1 type I site-specific deoxyribonuclease, HsdR family [Staphylococcus epidermidis VCU050]KAB2165531.1 type I restriction endonuclease subunit R [Staphylococcus epidermidis]KAB2174226.1 type I restriction endonuclease subunit R [Staphylococcus epidermidis]KAB2196887.1 type I restriction endonuclease subunit R [Sta
MNFQFNEDDLEQVALEWLQSLGYDYKKGNEISMTGLTPERKSDKDVVLHERLEKALRKINSDIHPRFIEKAIHELTLEKSPNLLENNLTFHENLINGIEIEDYDDEGQSVVEIVKIVDFEYPQNNDFLAVNQFTVVNGDYTKRPDIVLFINGLPIVVIELKNSTIETVGVEDGYRQLETYKMRIPQLFTFNEVLVTSDGINTKAGSLTANYDRFMTWRSKDGETESSSSLASLDVLIHGMLNPETLLDLIRYFVLFQDDGKGHISKILAAYHQYYAVNKAVDRALLASSGQGDGKGGVIWHTQGSGKSLTMVFFSGKLIQMLNNPTLVVVTDRNDLDNQLYSTFVKSKGRSGKGLLRQTPKQAETRKELKSLLSVESGGIVFTTMQKFEPEQNETTMSALTERKNVIVMADEAHRTQYGFNAKYDDKGEGIKYGYAKYLRDALPNATFVGFTGTPVASTDKNTQMVFGNYIDVYDMTQAVADGSTVKIYYESRIIPLNLPQNLDLDEAYNDITEDQEEDVKQRLKSKWSRIEALAGAKPRVEALAKDIIQHFETRQQAMKGKGMIVTMSRRIAVDLYDEIIRLKPEWHSDDDDKGVIKVVMTGSSSDPTSFQRHIGPKKRRNLLEKRMKDMNDELQLVIVRDMWLTGFDVPSMHTMYIDKPMKGHNLMQAIARVNRVFKDKPGGLIVDYVGIAESLKEALKEYTESDQAQTAIDTDKAVELMLLKYDVIQDMLYNLDYSKFNSEKKSERYYAISDTMDYVIGLGEDERQRFIKTVTELGKAFALCATEPTAQELNDEIAFFKAVKAGLVKLLQPPKEGKTRKTPAEVEAEINQLVSQSVVTEDVIDVYQTLGLEQPDLSILSDDFLKDVEGLKQKNVAVELLNRLLKGQVKSLMKTNATVSKRFSEMLGNSINKYNSRSIETSKVIEELIQLAKDIKQEQQRGNELGLNSDEIAFYDALASHETAKEAMGDKELRAIAHELTKTVKENMGVDWSKRDSAKAKMRVAVRRLLKKYGYPPDLQKMAVEQVVEQAELMASNQ